MPTSGALSVGHRGTAAFVVPVRRANWAKATTAITTTTRVTTPNRLLRGGAGRVAWSGHLSPTGVRMAQSGQIGVSHSTQVSLVATPCRTHISPGAPSTAERVSIVLGRLGPYGCDRSGDHRGLPAGGADVPATRGVQEGRPRRRPLDVRRRRPRLAGLLGPPGPRPARLVEGVGHHPGVG